MTKSTASPPAEQQLALFPAVNVPARFRLDEATVRRGRKHIAEIRKMLAASAAADAAEPQPAVPPRHLDSPRAA